MSAQLTRRSLLRGAAAVAAGGALSACGASATAGTTTVTAALPAATPVATAANGGPLTVALVHGAFADSSSWSGVIERLRANGHQVVAVANPLRGINVDSAYVASVLSQISGPVLVVGHSYGGAVISNAGARASNVVGLVYVAAFAPDEGEKLSDVTAASKDAILGTALVPHKYPLGTDQAVEFSIDPTKAHAVFAADLPAAQADLVAAVQRPIADLGFSEPSGPPAWKKLPSWAVVAKQDLAAGTDVVRAHAKRAGATITELDGSHVIMISQPKAVADVIEAALGSLGHHRD